MSSNRIFEVMFILFPNLEEEEIDKIINQLTHVISDKGGKVAKTDKMGRRRLAYEIPKGNQTFREGYYVLLTIEGSGAEIAETERRLRVLDPVIRYLTVRIDEDLKRAKKVQDRRSSKTTRRSRGGDEADLDDANA
ncbi:MAG: 30S ribosomal protein S6 [Acidobacteria bacterium]|nr:30S ribosomal protein S6 [Acidobacteriota bacterium]